MKYYFLWIILALFTGSLIPVQAATNATLSRVTGSPFITAWIAFALGLLVVSSVIIIKPIRILPLNQLEQVPLYSFCGGLIVTLYIVLITYLVPRIGVGAAIGLIVTGQIMGALLIDHFGFFRVAPQRLDIKRLAGLIMMTGGIYLIMKPKS